MALIALAIVGPAVVLTFLVLLSLRYGQAKEAAARLLEGMGDGALTPGERQTAVRLIRVLRFGRDRESKELTARLVQAVTRK